MFGYSNKIIIIVIICVVKTRLCQAEITQHSLLTALNRLNLKTGKIWLFSH